MSVATLVVLIDAGAQTTGAEVLQVVLRRKDVQSAETWNVQGCVWRVEPFAEFAGRGTVRAASA